MLDSAVLIDMDGLLVDTEPLWFEAERMVAACLGWTYTYADHAALVGVDLSGTAEYLLEKAPERLVRPVATVAEDLTVTLLPLIRNCGVSLKEGARSLLVGVAAEGLPHALVTSSDSRITYAVLNAIGMRFDVTVCAHDVTNHKPDPEPYLLAAQRLGVPPKCCTILEDSGSGALSAERAGGTVILVPSTADIEARPNWIVIPSLSCLEVGPKGVTVIRGATVNAGRDRP
jgi:HAD superfamily hydrolase (TIGR01509 family)